MKLLNEINAKLKDDIRFRIVLILCSILLIAVREPALLLYPRLWAEEGCIFYQFALHHSLYEIFTTPHVGYLTLFNSIVSALQAKIFSVENAAIVSTYMGFLMQLTPVYIISFTNHKFWDNPMKKMLCVLAIIVVAAPELWLNTTNSHFIFGLTTFLIMIISINELSKFQRYFFRVLLIIGGLTGPASVLFTPAFLLKAYREKNKEKYLQAGLLSICAIIQMSVITYSIFFNNTYHRLSNHNVIKTIYHYFIDNFSMLPHASIAHLYPIMVYFDPIFGLLMALLFFYLLIKLKNNTDYFISLASLLIVGTFSTLGSLNMEGSPRYAYIPSCIFVIIIISESLKTDVLNIKLKSITSFVLIFCLAVNSVYYRGGMRSVYTEAYPKWANEVAKWHADSAYAPMVHPGLDAGQCVKL
ncbi:MAG TPA: hypothetical protein VNX01_12475 [Bacteroidia bacterium]|nr:hypothetical protein [Bacteroidia bacterium]